MDFLRLLGAMAAEHRKATGRPFVTLSYAQSLDGCISARPGEALVLSGRQSMKLTHRLRAGHDAILVGIGTVLSDNPRLTVRLVNGRSPRPVVVDSMLRLPLESRLLCENLRPPWVVTAEFPDPERRKALEAAGAKIIPVPRNGNGYLDLGVVLEKLGELGLTSVMVEGGSRIITSFLKERLADYLVLTVAPIVVGGMRGVRHLQSSDMDHFRRLKNPQHRRMGEDLVLWGELT